MYSGATEADKDAQLTADSQFKMKANIENQGWDDLDMYRGCWRLSCKVRVEKEDRRRGG